jgi:hypothetical protein
LGKWRLSNQKIAIEKKGHEPRRAGQAANNRRECQWLNDNCRIKKIAIEKKRPRTHAGRASPKETQGPPRQANANCAIVE